MTQRRVVTVAGAPEPEAAFATALARRGDTEVVFRCVDRVELLAAIRGAAPDLIVCVGCPSWLDRQACDEAVTARIPVVGLSSSEDDAEAFSRLGILVLPATADADRVLRVASSGDALPEAPAALARSLGEGGRLVVVGFTGGSIPEVKVNRLLLKNTEVIGAGWGAYVMGKPEVNREIGAAVKTLVDEGFVRPIVGARFPLEQAADALELIDSRQATGKVVLDVPGA